MNECLDEKKEKSNHVTIVGESTDPEFGVRGSVVTKLKENKIGTLVLNRPEKMNALSREFVADIIKALRYFKEEKARVVILKAVAKETKKGKIWSTGHDVKEIPDAGRDPLGWEDPLVCLVREIKNSPYPIIAAVEEGGVFGGMCEVVFSCSMIVAEENVTFAFTPAKMSVPYNMVGLATFMNDAGLHLLKEMICTAEPISASRLKEAGVINYVVSADKMEERVNKLAESTARNAPLAISAMLAELNLMAGTRAMSVENFERMQGLRRKTYDSKDYGEARNAFFEKRAPVFSGE